MEGKVDSTGALCEVSETIVGLTLSVDDLVTCLLNQVSLILPQVVCLLQLSILFEQAWAILLHVVVEEALGRHGAVVTLGDLIVVGHLLLDRLVS